MHKITLQRFYRLAEKHGGSLAEFLSDLQRDFEPNMTVCQLLASIDGLPEFVAWPDVASGCLSWGALLSFHVEARKVGSYLRHTVTDWKPSVLAVGCLSKPCTLVDLGQLQSLGVPVTFSNNVPLIQFMCDRGAKIFTVGFIDVRIGVLALTPQDVIVTMWESRLAQPSAPSQEVYS